MADNIRGLKFFMEGRVNEWLAYKTDKEKIDGFLIEDGDHFVIDIIEQPFHCEASAENGDAKLELYVRNEFGAYMEPDLSIVIHPGNAKPEFKRSGKISGDGMKQLLLFMRAASVLKRYSDRFGFARLYPDYDPDREGIIVRREGDEPTFQRVRGKNRPPLAVRNMVGNVELARPYENELVSVLGMELSAFEARLEEAEDGDTEAMRDIAEKYVTGYMPEEIAPDPKKAFFWMNRLAEEGDADALYRVGQFKARGFGTNHSFEEAAGYMHKAVRAGHPEAKKAAEQYAAMARDEAKALNNDPQAMAELAASYMLLAGSQDRDNAKQDYEESRKWAERSVTAGNGFGCWVLGLLYEHGRGVEKDLEKAAELYEHGSDLGNREAQNNLGTFLMQGMGMPQDKRRAFSLFQAAAEQGYGVAMRNLGNCYQYAYGTDGNMKKAMMWYERALDVLDDPELAQKVQLFRQMEEVDPDWGMDYPEQVDPPKEEKLDSPLKEALRAQGRPYDDEAINNLSVEEVFELLGTVEHEYEQYAAAGEPETEAPAEEVPAEIPAEEESLPELPAEPQITEEPEAVITEPETPEPEEAPVISEPEEPAPEKAPEEPENPELADVMNILFGDKETAPAEEPVTEEPEAVPAPEEDTDLPEVPETADEETPLTAEADEPDFPDLPEEPAAEAAFPESLELTRAMNGFGVMEPEGEQPEEAGSDLFEEEEPEEEETEFRERVYESDIMARRIRNPKYRLTYTEGNTCGNERYTIAIPDGFRVEPDAEGRDFIAWLPDDADNDRNNARITLYAGAEAGKNTIDTRLLTPEICALLTESNYWQADALRLLAEKNRLIVLNETHPAGSIIAGYNDGSFTYSISIVMPGYIKTMRARILGAEEEDIPSCDRMVLEWIRTMTAADTFEETKALDDAYFTAQPLTDALASEWKETCNIRYTVLERSCRDNIELARQRYAKGAYGVDGEAAFRADLQNYLDIWAEGYGNFLESGISAIETLKEDNPGNPALARMIEAFRPALNGAADRTEAVSGPEDTVSASVSGLKELRSRVAELDREPEEAEEALPAYRELTYHENHEFRLGDLCGLLPDGMVTFDHAPESEANDPEFLKKLHSIYSLAAIPADYAGGFNRYTEGAFCLNIGSPVKNSGFEVLFENGTEEEVQRQLVQFLTANLKRNNKYNEHYPVEYVSGGKDYGIVAAQTSGNRDLEATGASFVFLVLDRNDLYQGNIYFRSEGTDEQFREATYNWLETIVRNGSETAQPIAAEQPVRSVSAAPATREEIEKKYRADRLRNALKKEWKWISLHGREIARNPEINVEDALFVFTGAAGLSDFPEILNRLEAKGGIRRDVISARTDYLVCNPAEAGETRIAAAREMKQNGSALKIVLLNDLRKALGMKEVDLRTELEELTGTHIEPEVKLEDIEPEPPVNAPEEVSAVDANMSDMSDADGLVKEHLQNHTEAEEVPAEEPVTETESAEEEPQPEETEPAEAEEPAAEEQLFDLPMDILEDRDPMFDTLGFNITAMDEEIHRFTDAAEAPEEPADRMTESEPDEEIESESETTEAESEAEEAAETAEEEISEASMETEETVREESEEEPASEEPDELPEGSAEEPENEAPVSEDEESKSEITEEEVSEETVEAETPEVPAEADEAITEETPETAETDEVIEASKEVPGAGEPFRGSEENEPEPETAEDSGADERSTEAAEAEESETRTEAEEAVTEETPETEETADVSEESEAPAETDEEPVEEAADESAEESETEEPASEEEETEQEAEPEEEATEPEEESATETEEPAAEESEDTADSAEAEPEERSEEKSDDETEEEAAEEPEPEPEEDPAVKAYTAEALTYLGEKTAELDSFKQDWGTFSNTVARTLMLKIQNGLTPKVNEGDDGDKNVSFESDTSEADEFVDSIPEKVDRKLERLSDGIRDFNKKLEDYEANGLNEMVFLKLCRAFTQFKETGRNLSLKFTSRDISYPLSEEVEAIGEKWEEKYRENKERLDAFEQEESAKAPKEPEEAPLELKPEEAAEPASGVTRAAAANGPETEMMSRTDVHRQIEALLAQDTAEDDGAEEPGKTSGNKALLILLVVVILACIGVAAYWYVTNYLPAHQASGVFRSENVMCAQFMRLFYLAEL